MDVTLLIAIILIVFILWELFSGEVPLRWFGSLRRDERPFFYWISILLHVAILGVVAYAWVDGFRMPLSELFD